jgi:hypothetical protein
MFFSEQKKKENIAEYMLYMWQLEDMLRACHFEVDVLCEQLVDPLKISDELKIEAREWYVTLARQMKMAKIEQKGHLYELIEIATELFLLHTTAVTSLNNKAYNNAYETAQPLLSELMKKQGGIHNEVEAALTFLYGIWLLRLKRKEISEETKDAIPAVSGWLAQLSKMYIDMKSGKLDFTKN